MRRTLNQLLTALGQQLPQHGVVRLLGLPRLLLCCMARCCQDALWRSRAARQPRAVATVGQVNPHGQLAH